MTDRPQKLRNSKNMCQPGHTRTPPRALRRPPNVEPRSHAAPPHASALVLVLPSPWSPPRRPPPWRTSAMTARPAFPPSTPSSTNPRPRFARLPPRRARPRPPPRTRRRPRPGTRTRPRPRPSARSARPWSSPPSPSPAPSPRRSRSGRITSSASSRSCTSSASRASSTGPSSRASSTAPWSRALSRTSPRGDSKSTRERRLRLLHGALPPGAPPDLRHRREPRG